VVRRGGGGRGVGGGGIMGVPARRQNNRVRCVQQLRTGAIYNEGYMTWKEELCRWEKGRVQARCPTNH